MIIYGTRFFGRVFPIPGVGFVATMFFHLFWIPLIPVQSWIVLAEGGDDFEGIKIPLSGWSVLAAYARAAIVLGAIGALVSGVVLAMDLGSAPSLLQKVAVVCDFALALAAIPSWILVRGLARPTAARRAALLRQLGIQEDQDPAAGPAAGFGAAPVAPPRGATPAAPRQAVTPPAAGVGAATPAPASGGPPQGPGPGAAPPAAWPVVRPSPPPFPWA